MADRQVLQKKLDGFSIDYQSKRTHQQRKSPYSVILLAVLVCVLLFMSYSFGRRSVVIISQPAGSGRSTNDWGGSVTVNGRSVPVGEYISDNIVPENIKSNLKFLTSKPHIAGKERNSELAHSIYEQWKNYGFDSVDMSNYTVLLDYVNRSNYNVLTLQNSNGDNLYVANTTVEKPLIKEEDYPDVPPPFNAYSGVGQAKGPLVYVNYGEIQDFEYLTEIVGLNLTGYICIVRYGKLYRGNKARLAQEYGCSGLIIYSDPLEYAPKGGPSVFPYGPALPSTGLQRGTLAINTGDPLTPGLPSIDMVYRRSYKEAVKSGDVPSIPVQPISYGDAVHFLSQLSLYSTSKEWTGGLNITYHILQSKENTNVTYLEVNNEKQQATINDVVGIIYGSIEPDHLVILGNHRDAWTFGAVDPNSGTAVLMELARVLGDMKSKGWRPGRTIVLCSWDAEEYGAIGSTEWVEHYQKVLGANAVAYLNVDVAVEGRTHISASSSPLLFDIIYNTAKQVSCPDKKYDTLYDQWKYWFPHSKPGITNLGAGSDFVAFIQFVGITAADLFYTYEDDFVYYSVYHSVHDNFYWSETFDDPNYTYHKAMGELWSRIALALVTTPLLPFNPIDYSDRLTIMLAELLAESGDTLSQHNVSTELLNLALHNFSVTAVQFKGTLQNYTNTKDENVIRILNKKLMNLERAFILPQGLPGQLYNRHVIMAPSSTNSYAGGSFPGVVDSIFKAMTSRNWNEVQKQIDTVAVHVIYATQVMEQPGLHWLNH